VGIGVADTQGNILTFNDAILKPGGYTHDDIQKIGNVSALYYDAEERETALALFLAQGSLHQHEVRFRRKDGTPYDVWLSLTRTTFNAVSCIQAIVEDRTEKKRAEEEHERLETQLREAAKMESIGRLAGGVAHDYNNMLAVILGHVQLALEQVSPDDTLYADLREIKEAADRSAGITQQLLAFARRQVTIPRVIDLNKAVQGTMGMLGRLIGEQVRLTWIPGKDIGRVQIDPAQLDQLLVNLCLNARDAIVEAGKVVIQTADVTLDDQYCAEHEGCTPGDYTRLSVSDNGTGISPEALEHLFEPFFTTKDTGKGTGLGLATVYGIVRQNEGFIQVESDETIGTQVHIYLPRVDAEAAAEDHELIPTAAPRGTETLLVVEDEPSVLRLTQRILVDLGYQVLTALQPSDALLVAQEHTDIAMVITDIVMPDMNGRELSERLRALRPGLRVLYVSGYTDEVPLADAALQEGVDFLQKPFTLQSLATIVRTILDRE
jgi:two-component system cell cycle sensor histidine kinase/response regulator CckA